MSRVLDQRSGAAAGTTSTGDGGDWRDRAACLDTDPDLWFAADEERAKGRKPRVAKAKAVCAACPVTYECLRWALEHDQREGVWGGLDEDQRRAARRPRRPGRPPATQPPKDPKTRSDPTARPTCGSDPGYRAHTNASERQCDACRDWKQERRREGRAA